MMVRLHLVTPTRLGFEVLARLNYDRIGEIPFQSRAVNSVLVRHRLTAEYLALYDGRTRPFSCDFLPHTPFSMPRPNVVSKSPRAHQSARQSLNLCLPEGQGDEGPGPNHP